MPSIQSLEKSYGDQVTLIKGSKEHALSELCPPHTVSENALVIIKDKKALPLLKVSGQKGLTLIATEKFWNQIKDQAEGSELQKQFDHIATVVDAAVVLAKWSKEFHDIKKSRLNNFVDGRQMGTADVHPTAMIAQGAFIGQEVVIGENVIIHSGAVLMSKVEIGAGSEIFPNATIYPYTKIGKNARIHAGSVIGADGFGYVFNLGVHQKIWHFGGVIIGDDVEIGANSCVDGGTFSPTRLGTGTKLDNHVQIGHNCQLGRGVIVCGHVAIGGSTEIGDFTVFGGKSGSGDNYKIGAQCQIAGGALVNCDWPDKSIVGGHPARPLKEWMRGLAYVRKMSLGENKGDN